MDNPKITIVTICYNAADVVEETILSVVNQTYPNVEYIIIDGNSTDGTVDIIKKYESNISYWVSEPDGGIYDAMNKGIKMATGEWINFMNAGDMFFDTGILEYVAYMIKDETDFLFGDEASYFGEKLLKIKAYPFYEHLPLHRMSGFNHQCSFVKTSVAKKNLFDLSFKLAADYKMMIDLYRQGKVFQQIPIVIAIYDRTGITSKRKGLYLYETLKVDYPNRKVLNKIVTDLLLARGFVHRLIRRPMMMLLPKLMLKYENKQNRFVEITKDDNKLRYERIKKYE